MRLGVLPRAAGQNLSAPILPAAQRAFFSTSSRRVEASACGSLRSRELSNGLVTRVRGSHANSRRSCACKAAHQQSQQQHCTVRVRFRCHHHCNWGEHLVLAGSHECLGEAPWDPATALKLEWSDGDAWTVDCELPAGAKFDYKYVVVKEDGSVDWQPGGNLTMAVSDECRGTVIVQDEWTGEQRLVCAESVNSSWGAALTSNGSNGAAAAPRDAEEAVAQADVGVFTYVEVKLGKQRSFGSNGATHSNGHSHKQHANGANGHLVTEDAARPLSVSAGAGPGVVHQLMVAEPHASNWVSGGSADLVERLRAAMRAASDPHTGGSGTNGGTWV